MKIKADKDIVLQKIRVKSAGEIYDCIDGSREFLGKWLPFVDETKSKKDTEKYIRSVVQAGDSSKEMIFEVWYRDKIVGLIGLKDIDLTNKKAEIGYWLTRDATGKGIMTQSCKALLQYVFRELKINKIWIRCAVENVRSCNIPKQLGFTFEGTERQGEILHGKYLDLKIYSLLKKEWEKVRREFGVWS